MKKKLSPPPPITQLIRFDKYGNEYEIPVQLLNIPSIPCPTLWVVYLDERVGEESTVGQVFSAHCGPYTDYIFKRFIPLDDNEIQLFQDEAYFQNLAHQAGLTTPIYDAFIYYDEGQRYVGFITLRLRETLAQTMESIFATHSTMTEKRDQLLPLLEESLNKLRELHAINILHGDAHPNNFMFDNDGKILLIDFGKSRYIDEDDKVEDIKEDYRIFLDSWGSFLEEFNFNMGDSLKTASKLLDYAVPKEDFEERLIRKVVKNLGKIIFHEEMETDQPMTPQYFDEEDEAF